MIVRCTQKIMVELPPDTPLIEASPTDEDWYLNLLWLERRKCLLLVHAGTLFAVFRPAVRKADLRNIGSLPTDMIRGGLERERLPHHTFGPLPSDTIAVAKTASRRTLGHMNEMATHLRYATAHHGGLDHCDIDALNHDLHRTLHNREGHYIRPIDLAHMRARHGG